METAPHAPPRRANGWLRGAVLVALVFASYAGAAGNALVFDDIPAVQENPVVNGSVPLREAFTRDFWGQSPSRVVTYRPVPVLLAGLEWRAGHGAPSVLHVSSAVLHAVVIVVAWLVWSGVVGELAAFGGAALMAVLAAPSEAVFAVYGQADLLATLFATLGLAAHRRRSRAGGAMATLLYGLALLSKESAVVAPVAWFWLDRVLPVSGERPKRGRWFAYAGMAAAVFMVRQRVLGSVVPARGELGNPLLDAPLLQRLLGAGHILLTRYGRDLLLPTEWQYDCSYAACLPGQPSDPVAWLGLLLAVLLCVAPLMLWRRAPKAAGLLGWSVLFFAPVSNFLVPAPVAYASRWLYQPLFGLCLLGGVGAVGLAARVRRPALVRAGWALLLFANMSALWNRQRDWETEEAFYNSGLVLASRSALVQGGVAYWNITHGDPEKAIVHAREALAIAPGFARAHQWLGAALDQTGHPAEAESEFATAVRLAPTPGAHYAYATFLASHRELRRALEVARAGQQVPGGASYPRLEALVRSLERDLAGAQ